MFVLFLLGGIQNSFGIQLLCEYEFYNFDIESLYSCNAINVDNKNNKMIITEAVGEHLPTKNDQDVKQIRILSAKILSLPEGLGFFTNLYGLFVSGTTLKDIQSNDFLGLESLQYLNLGYNKLSSIPTDAFTHLKKLRVIELSANNIKEIKSGTFSNNLDLEQIWLTSNKIQFIGPMVFNHLINLNIVDLGGNICVSKRYHGTAVNELKNGLKSCLNPICNEPSMDLSNDKLIETQKLLTKCNEIQLEQTKNQQEMETKIEKLEEDLRKANQEIKKILELHGSKFFN